MPQPLRVALLIECSRSYGRNLLAGIAAYAHAFGPWTFYHEERALGDPLPVRLKSWRPQGIIARLENKLLTRQIRRLGLPTVGVLHEKEVSDIPGVIPDPDATVRLAVEHLVERGLRHFAYCGFPGVKFSDDRCRLFVEGLAALGSPCDVFQYRRSPRAQSLAEVERDAMRHGAELAAWLHRLPKPVGLMASNDMRAYQVLSVCGQAKIGVPDEVAVIGVDNDFVQCELSDPTLTSVDNNSYGVGYEAAALLHRLIGRRGAVPAMTFVPPVGVIARRSTDLLAVADPKLVEIVRYVREEACAGLTAEKLVRHTGLSRSTLERWFAGQLGRSVNEEIHRVRLSHVKDLLVTSELSLSEIARRCGFAYAETMQRLFKAAVGETPGQYRAHRRQANSSSPGVLARRF
jgi:LacI family transcriptional regulator